MAEIIKIAACFDRKLFQTLEKFNYNNINEELLEIIKSAINLKLSIVTEDKYE